MNTKFPTMDHVAVGEDVLIGVVPSPNRTTFFPEQAAVFGRGADSLEIVLMRQEVVLRSQIGKVVSDQGDHLQLEFRPNAVETEMVDIAHLRMAFGSAIDMAFGILSLAVANDLVKPNAVLKRLQNSAVQST